MSWDAMMKKRVFVDQRVQMQCVRKRQEWLEGACRRLGEERKKRWS
jgi:hypothetical protein